MSNLNEEDLSLFYKEMVGCISSLFGLKTSSDVTELSESTLGCFNGFQVLIDSKFIKDNPESVLNAIFHELIHSKQNKDLISDKVISANTLTFAKDMTLLKLLGKEYKNPNYNQEIVRFPHEHDAYLGSYNDCLWFFNQIGHTPSNEFWESMYYSREFVKPFLMDDTRVLGDEITDLDTFFEREIFFHPELFNKYPQISFEYKLEEDHVVRKTSQEMEEDYAQYKDGKIELNGDRNEICNLYESKIMVLKSKEDNIQKS